MLNLSKDQELNIIAKAREFFVSSGKIKVSGQVAVIVNEKVYIFVSGDHMNIAFLKGGNYIDVFRDGAFKSHSPEAKELGELVDAHIKGLIPDFVGEFLNLEVIHAE